MNLMRGRMADMGAFAHLFGGKPPAKAAEPAPEAKPEEEDPEAKGEETPPEEPKAEGEAPPAEEPEEEDPEEARAAGAAAERARCRAIFAAPAAAANVALAAHLAFDTDQTADQAIATLALGGKSASGLGARMAGAPNPALGAGGAPKPGADSAEVLAAQITASARIARGGKA